MKEPGCPNSRRIRTLSAVPTNEAQPPRIKYKVPMSLWFVEKIHCINEMAEGGIKL